MSIEHHAVGRKATVSQQLRRAIFMEDDESEQKEMFLYYSLKLGKLLGFRKTL
jgi:hypothetical protein